MPFGGYLFQCHGAVSLRAGKTDARSGSFHRVKKLVADRAADDFGSHLRPPHIIWDEIRMGHVYPINRLLPTDYKGISVGL